MPAGHPRRLAQGRAQHPRFGRCCGSRESPSTWSNSVSKPQGLWYTNDIHHDLPGVHRQIRIVERPVEFLLCLGLVGGIVVGSKVLVRQSLTGADSLLGVKDQHSFQKVHRCVLSAHKFTGSL